MATEAEVPGGATRSWFASAVHAARGLWRPRVAQPIAAESDAAPALEELAPLLNAAPDPAILVDAAGRIAASNEEARRRWGAEPGMRLSAALRHPPLLDAALFAGRDQGVRTIEDVLSPDAEEHFLCSVAPLEWRGIPAILLTFRNRTAQIAAERMRVDFVANASHELRTPLTALSMLIETIAGPARDNEADRNRFLHMMQVQADRMRRLIDDLLALSRIELDEHVRPLDRADLLAAAREAADSAAPMAAQRRVRIEVSPAHDPIRVVGDRFQIAQVAQNLIDNAVKFSPPDAAVIVEVGMVADRDEAVERAGRRWPNAGRISMHASPPSAGRSFAYLRVVDHGTGIAMRHLPRLGERFFRVEREEGSDRGGTGLGLAIVKHIVSRHRGGMLVESEPGKGSAFAVYFEAAEDRP